jgi:hypothetical protein
VEKEPVRALEGLKAEYKAVQETRMAQRKQAIASTSRNAWISQLHRIRAEGKAKELIMVEGNTDHNEKVVRPVLTQAATEYGKLVNILAEDGLEVLSEKAANALAASVLLAHASAVSLHTQRTAGFTRPAIGTSGTETNAGRPAIADTPKAAAQGLINSVLLKK